MYNDFIEPQEDLLAIIGYNDIIDLIISVDDEELFNGVSGNLYNRTFSVGHAHLSSGKII